MITGDFRTNNEAHKKNYSPNGKRVVRSGMSMTRRLSPGKVGMHYQKPETIDITSGHSRNDSKNQHVFNSKISEALRSNGGFSSIRGANTPLGYNLT